MSNMKQAYLGCQIFDGFERHNDCALLVDGECLAGVVTNSEIPREYNQVTLDKGLICSGFVDLQVNGGGGVLLNDSPTAKTMETISAAHLPFGTTAILPTLITDTAEQTRAAIHAGHEVISSGNSGVLGLHLEGPHLCLTRKGTHDAQFIRSMQQTDLDDLVSAAATLPALMLTIATESVTFTQIAELNAAGAVICLGHTDASYADACAAVEHGVSGITHLFNAMSPLGNREPGVVGAALQSGALSAGIIADGHHVDAATIEIALRAKRGPGKLFLVTDAMSIIGTDLKELRLNDRLIKRQGGRLTLEDGTLAGADLDMISAVQFMVEKVGVAVDEALRMASLYPAQLLKMENQIGQLCNDARADFLHLSEALEVKAVWRGGEQLFKN